MLEISLNSVFKHDTVGKNACAVLFGVVLCWLAGSLFSNAILIMEDEEEEEEVEEDPKGAGEENGASEA